MKITYHHLEPERGERRRYAVIVDGQQVGIVRKFEVVDYWDFVDRRDLHTPRKRRQDAVAAGIADPVSAPE